MTSGHPETSAVNSSHDDNRRQHEELEQFRQSQKTGTEKYPHLSPEQTCRGKSAWNSAILEEMFKVDPHSVLNVLNHDDSAMKW